MLGHYFQDFDTVELNNTFYRLPTLEMVRAWADAVPEGFLFAVKGNRFITHNLKFNNPQNALERFLPVVELLGKKVRANPVSDSPAMASQLERLETFLSLLPRHHYYAFELRDRAGCAHPCSTF